MKNKKSEKNKNNKMRKIGLGIAVTLLVSVMNIGAQELVQQRHDDYPRDIKIDRFLDVEVWPNHSDGEYYEGENIVINFRSSADAFVAIYSIDSRGRVNLLFPSRLDDNNFVRGGVTYELPGGDDDYDLMVSGPEGSEQIQIIASREKFLIPNWYRNSGLVFEGDDRNEYMDFLNARHFARYGGQRFAFDRATIFVNEWEDYYYRPVYHSYYPSWSIFGNVYIDYPYGGTVYINGTYYGHAPLYIPRLLVGWHYVTIYDHHGYSWEQQFHVSYYNTTIFDQHHIQTSQYTVSRYKEVLNTGYRNPLTSGYPNFKTRNIIKRGSLASKGSRNLSGNIKSSSSYKYARGSTKLTKSTRGYETVSVPRSERKITKSDNSRFKSRREGARAGQEAFLNNSTRKTSRDTYHSSSTRKGKRSSGSIRSSSGKSGKNSDYYQKKSSKSKFRNSGKTIRTTERTAKSGSRKSGTVKAAKKSGKSSKSSSGKSGSYKKSGTKSGSSGKAGKVSKGGSKPSKSSGRTSSSRSKKSGSRKGRPQ